MPHFSRDAANTARTAAKAPGAAPRPVPATASARGHGATSASGHSPTGGNARHERSPDAHASAKGTIAGGTVTARGRTGHLPE